MTEVMDLVLKSRHLNLMLKVGERGLKNIVVIT